MKYNFSAIRGMRDIFPGENQRWDYVQNIIRKEAELYGFGMIRTPVLEFTELFERSAGETTDVVQKEMYTFTDKGGRSVSMRPEGTAGVLRAVLESGLYQNALPQKLMYLSSCYRYEKPQAGRFREFYQYGFEIFGGNSPTADAEIMCLGNSIFKHLGIDGVNLHINAVCCSSCRDLYLDAIRKYFGKRKKELCRTCAERLEKNPMRIFDCKDPNCAKVYLDAPISLSYLCEECAAHFEDVKDILTECGVKYTVNPFIVRGLDYYTRIAFEFVAKCGGVSSTVCGGGRYDDLSKEMGGPRMTAVGMGIGMDRLLMLMEDRGIAFKDPDTCDVYIISMGKNARLLSAKLSEQIRRNLIRTEIDLVRRNIKPNMRYANKIGAKYCLIIGNNELESGEVNVKDMETGEQFTVSLGEGFITEFLQKYTKAESAKQPERDKKQAKRLAENLMRIQKIEERENFISGRVAKIVSEEFTGPVIKKMEEMIREYNELKKEKEETDKNS